MTPDSGRRPERAVATTLALQPAWHAAARRAGPTPADRRLAIEGGGTVYQDLNGPQLGRSWQFNLALGTSF